MNINEAKQIRLVEYLRIIGHSPVNARGCQYWYLSPLREERTPSFKVNDNLNEWYDFGLSAGGDIIELGKHLYRTGNVSARMPLAYLFNSYKAGVSAPVLSRKKWKTWK